MNIYIAIACLLASVNADGPLGVGGLGGLVYAPGHASADYYSYPRYAFEYSVKDPHTGDNKAQWEKREGDVVKGAYSLVEPDGSLRVVEYYADDKSGFNAVVKRIGPNLHPTTVHAAPIYKAAIPVLGHGPIVSPISIGPVAKLGHLAGAPLISGPVHGAVSSQSLYKSSVPVIKPLIQELGPILPPIHQEPIPILPQPIIKSVPILSGPIYKAGPIYSKPLGPPPYYKAPLPIYNEPLPIYKQQLPIYKEQLPIYKEQLPIYKESLPIYNQPLPIYKEQLPIYKESLPIYNQPLPIYKEQLPIYKEQLPIYKEQLPIYKEPLPIYNEPLLKAPYGLGPVGHLEGINYGGIGPIKNYEGYNKGLNPYGPLHGIPKIPIGPGYELIEKGPLDYSLINYKH